MKAGLPGAIVEKVGEEEWVINGARRSGVNLAISDAQFDEFREGRRCIRCFGPQPEPFPDECVEPFCSFRIRDDQLRFLEVEHRGTHRYGPTPIEDLDTEREFWTRKSGVLVPRNPKETSH